MRYGTNKEKNTKLGEGLWWLAKESHGIRKKKKNKVLYEITTLLCSKWALLQSVIVIAYFIKHLWIEDASVMFYYLFCSIDLRLVLSTRPSLTTTCFNFSFNLFVLWFWSILPFCLTLFSINIPDSTYNDFAWMNRKFQGSAPNMMLARFIKKYEFIAYFLVNVTDTILWQGHHDRVMQLNWLYFCGICQMMPLMVRPNTALGCNHQSICLPQLGPLCSAALVPNVLPRRDEGSGRPCAVIEA